MAGSSYFIPSAHKKRNGVPSQLLVDKDENVYTWKRDNKNSKVWRCVKYQDKDCKVEVFTDLEVSF